MKDLNNIPDVVFVSGCVVDLVVTDAVVDFNVDVGIDVDFVVKDVDVDVVETKFVLNMNVVICTVKSIDDIKIIHMINKLNYVRFLSDMKMKQVKAHHYSHIQLPIIRVQRLQQTTRNRTQNRGSESGFDS